MNKTIKSALPYLFLAGLTFLLYFHIRNFKFTYLDDASLIIETSRGFSSDPLCIFRIFIKNIFHLSQQPQIWYRPIFTASFMINSIFSRNNLAGYYCANILLHALVSCLVLNLLIRLGYKKTPRFY